MWYTINRVNRKTNSDKIDFTWLFGDTKKVEDIATMSVTARWKRVFKK